MGTYHHASSDLGLRQHHRIVPVQKLQGRQVYPHRDKSANYPTMPPRIPFPSASLCCRATLSTPATSLTACLARLTLQQTRNASILGSLANNPGAVHKKKRVGRGPSSGHGKTSGRGHKGQGQHGKVKPWFQGGQTPLIVKHGRKGFDNL